MNWKSLTRDQPKRAFAELCEKFSSASQTFFLDTKERDFRDLRNAFLRFDVEASRAAEGKRSAAYVYDLEFALRMYGYLSEHDFGLWQAADNGVWAHLSIRVIPDVVRKRLGGMNEDRFYKRNWRIWLKDLWWYVYVTESDANAQFDMEESRELLTNGSQDIMFLLLDHSKGGFRPSVYYALMRKYSQVLNEGKVPDGRERFFRSLLLEHQIRTAVIDPILESETEYVQSLFDRVLPKYEKEGRR